MSRIILENELKETIINNGFIKNGSLNSCEGMKYDFRVSPKLLSPHFNRDRLYDEKDEANFIIKPGETAYVTTEEDLDLPNNIFCQLSTKRKLSHDGILLLGGFSIDPNYKGKLFFGLHNLSREDYPFRPGKKLVAGIFYELNNDEAKLINSNPESFYDFPDELVKNIKSFKSASTEALEEIISDLRLSVNNIKDQIDSDKSWRDDFKKGLTQNNEQISKLGISLEDLAKKLGQEIDERKLGEIDQLSKLSSPLDALTEKLIQEIDDRKQGEVRQKVNYAVVRGIGVVLGAIFGGGLLSLIIMYIAGILKFG